jgi:hypothetical protein
MDLNEITLDEGKTSGTWVNYGDARFLIRSTTSKEYAKAVSRISRKHPAHKVRKDTETQNAIATEAMAEALLLNFEGITNSGEKMANTVENRKVLCSNPVLREFIADAASDIANFRAGGEAEDAKDLKSAS